MMNWIMRMRVKSMPMPMRSIVRVKRPMQRMSSWMWIMQEDLDSSISMMIHQLNLPLIHELEPLYQSSINPLSILYQSSINLSTLSINADISDFPNLSLSYSLTFVFSTRCYIWIWLVVCSLFGRAFPCGKTNKYPRFVFTPVLLWRRSSFVYYSLVKWNGEGPRLLQVLENDDW